MPNSRSTHRASKQEQEQANPKSRSHVYTFVRQQGDEQQREDVYKYRIASVIANVDRGAEAALQIVLQQKFGTFDAAFPGVDNSGKLKYLLVNVNEEFDFVLCSAKAMNAGLRETARREQNSTMRSSRAAEKQ